MDFSSVPRALESLQRRTPPLDNDIVQVSTLLLNPNVAQEVCDHVTVLLQSTANRWESLAVGLFVATEALQAQLPRLLLESKGTAGGSVVYMEGPRVPSMTPSPTTTAAAALWTCPELSPDQIVALCRTLHTVSMEHLEDSEPRVRTLVAKAAGVYCKTTLLLNQGGEELRHEVHDRVVSSIQQHLEQGRIKAAEAAASKSSTGALDDTTGWRALETNWQCLAAIISAMGTYYLQDFGVFSDELLANLQHSCIVHVNRHVRAAGMAVLEQCIAAAVPSPEFSAQLLQDPESSFSKTTVAVLKDGLGDNWSQVRMAASVLCRAFLTALQGLGADLTPLFSQLLPRMCLNRFYLAQGVKLYSHETWKIVFVNGGIAAVAQHLGAICRYYVQMCDANNHVVREAACQAIAELAIRLGDNAEYKAQLKQQVELLLQALLMCFHDESWPVRDEACLACGILCKSYPEECRGQLGLLWERWTEQLTDQIWSVREDAAVALGDALEAYGPEFYKTKIQPLLLEKLPSAKQQAPMSMTEYKALQNDEAAHTDSQLFSCGSLAPKLSKRKDGAGRIGCSSCDVTRDRQLWEATDGCIYLVRELVIRCCDLETSVVPLSDAEIKSWLNMMMDVCRVQHFPQADDMRATMWRQIPAMANALGKERFKRQGYLELMVDLLFTNLESRSVSQLCQHAAGQCAEELAQLMGTAIFRGRLEDYQRDIFDKVMRERQAMPKGPAMMDSFSPFGPPGLLDHVNATGPASFPGRV